MTVRKRTRPIKISDEEFDELLDCLSVVADPRIERKSKHLLHDILILSILATICGAQGPCEIEDFGEERENWLQNFLELPHGIPSHDTIGRVLCLIDPVQFEAAFSEWVNLIIERKGLKNVSIDGKSVAGTHRRFANDGNRALHLVNVYSHDLGLTLAQSKAAGSGYGEADGALECLRNLNLKDTTVTMDAGLSTKRISHQIREQGGHYILPIKGNQEFSLNEIEQFFIEKNPLIAQKQDNAHGRIEERQAEVLYADNMSEKFYEQWKDIKTLIRLSRIRQSKDLRFATFQTDPSGDKILAPNPNSLKMRTKKETVYYISSRKLSPEEALREIRQHWGIENKLHWVLDVAFGEDECRVRVKALAQTLSVMRKIAFNIIKKSNTEGGIKRRMKRAGWNEKFLEKLLFG